LVLPVSAITQVSLICRLLTSMIGSFGSGGGLVEMNLTGSPVSF